MAQQVEKPRAMQETWIQSLGWDYPLEKEKIPIRVFWHNEFHRLYSPWGLKELDTTERLSLHFQMQYSLNKHCFKRLEKSTPEEEKRLCPSLSKLHEHTGFLIFPQGIPVTFWCKKNHRIQPKQCLEDEL